MGDDVMVQAAAKRGREDGLKGRPPLFRSTRTRGFVAEGDDPMSDDWDEAARAAYRAAYDEAVPS